MKGSLSKVYADELDASDEQDQNEEINSRTRRRRMQAADGSDLGFDLGSILGRYFCLLMLESQTWPIFVSYPVET